MGLPLNPTGVCCCSVATGFGQRERRRRLKDAGRESQRAGPENGRRGRDEGAEAGRRAGVERRGRGVLLGLVRLRVPVPAAVSVRAPPLSVTLPASVVPAVSWPVTGRCPRGWWAGEAIALVPPSSPCR